MGWVCTNINGVGLNIGIKLFGEKKHTIGEIWKL